MIKPTDPRESNTRWQVQSINSLPEHAPALTHVRSRSLSPSHSLNNSMELYGGSSGHSPFDNALVEQTASVERLCVGLNEMNALAMASRTADYAS